MKIYEMHIYTKTRQGCRYIGAICLPNLDPKFERFAQILGVFTLAKG